MSAVFVPQNVRGNKGQVSQETIQKLLDENSHLIQCIVDNQSKGKIRECAQYQQVLHRNLVWLATVADSNQGNAQSLMSQTSPKQGMPYPATSQQQPQVTQQQMLGKLSNESSMVRSISTSNPLVTTSTPAQYSAATGTNPVTAAVDVTKSQMPSQSYSVPQDPTQQPQYAQQQQIIAPTQYQGQYQIPNYPTPPMNTRPIPPQTTMQQQNIQNQPPPTNTPGIQVPQFAQSGMPVHGMAPSPNPGPQMMLNPTSSGVTYPLTQGQLPVSYTMSTTQSMMPQQQQYPISQPGVIPDQQRQLAQYGRPPTNQDPASYPTYSTPSSQHGPFQAPSQQPDYSQYNNNPQYHQQPYQEQ